MLISPGVLRSSWRLLNHITNNSLTTSQFLNPEVSYDVFGRASRQRVLQLCQGSQWIVSDENGCMLPSNTGMEIINQDSHIDVIRRQLRTIIFHTQPPWAKNIQYGRSELLNTVDPDIKQCFVEAGLADGTDEDTVKWWDLLAHAARGNLAQELLSIGRQGERRSLDFEYARTGFKAKYVALESSFPGYDILSRLSPTDENRLSIEVKSSERPLKKATFHLTRNEYKRALMSENYVFHLWLLNEKDRDKPCICTVEQVGEHCPTNQGSGIWESVEIPFNAFIWD